MVKKKELIEKIIFLERELNQKKEQNTKDALTIAHLHQIIRGERVCDGYCIECEHHIKKVDSWSWSDVVGPVSSTITCDLDCKCPEFTRKWKDRTK